MANLPSAQFKGKSRIGNYGDKIMEGDFHVGQILDALRELGTDDSTIVVFASDNGPYGQTAREFGNDGTPDMGSSGPFRGEATEGAIRTAAIIRWPGKVQPNTTSYAMFSIMDFMPTFARIVGGTMPTDRPIDGVDQTDVLLGKTAAGHRENLLSFIGANLVAARWKQWRIYFTDIHPTGDGPQRQPGGSLTIDRVCDQCNSELGTRVDAALCDFHPFVPGGRNYSWRAIQEPCRV